MLKSTLIRGVFVLAATSGLASATPVFTKDVLPILQRHCQSCHRPGEIGKMSLLTYEQARPWAKAIRDAARSRTMPPWNADPAIGTFRNARSLSAEEIEILAAWADHGAPRGSAAAAPAPVPFVEGWNIGQPDLILEMPVPAAIPAEGVLEYQHVLIPLRFAEDRWVTAMEFRPGNRSVTHHAVIFVRPPGSQWLPGLKAGEIHGPKTWSTGWSFADDLIGGYAPGAAPLVTGPGQARRIPAGSDLVLQLHYTPNGTATTDRSRVGLVFARTPPVKQVLSVRIVNVGLSIPPGAPNHPVKAAWTAPFDLTVIALMPHMHLRGKSFRYRAVDPVTGTAEELLHVPAYRFEWQHEYVLAEPRLLRKGTRIECVATYDNSPNNPRNPDPGSLVRWGDQSWNEMFVGAVRVLVDPGLEPADLYRSPKP